MDKLTVLSLLLIKSLSCCLTCRQAACRPLIDDLDFSRPLARNVMRASSMNDSGTFKYFEYEGYCEQMSFELSFILPT